MTSFDFVEYYAANFDEPSPLWHEYSDSECKTFRNGGFYHIAVTKPHWGFWQRFNGTVPDDYRVSVKAELLKHSGIGSSCGIKFRVGDNGHYHYAVSKSGYYRLSAINTYGEWSDIVPWLYSGYVRQNSENDIAVEVVGTTIRIIVNHAVLFEVEDEKFTSGGVAVCVYADSQPYAEASLRDFKLYYTAEEYEERIISSVSPMAMQPEQEVRDRYND